MCAPNRRRLRAQIRRRELDEIENAFSQVLSSPLRLIGHGHGHHSHRWSLRPRGSMADRLSKHHTSKLHAAEEDDEPTPVKTQRQDAPPPPPLVVRSANVELPIPPPLPPAAAAAADGAATRPADTVRGLMAAAAAEGSVLPPEEYLRRLRASAARLRDPSYSLHMFHDDMQACFPELRLYLGLGARESTTSGRSSLDEYIRTVYALFAVYWLCRLRLPDVPGSEALDGQAGFCQP